MAKSQASPSRAKILPEVLEALNTGTRATANLVEGLAVDFVQLMEAIHPTFAASDREQLASSASITERMRIAGAILHREFGIAGISEFIHHPSDTVRGWTAFVIGLEPRLKLKKRFDLIRPLADDPHFGVREWAWMPMRSHISANLEEAIDLLEPWTEEESPFLRRFAVEATRPRGVWTAHIEKLKREPHLGLKLLEPLKADPEKYVQDSVSNWLNDASKTQPDWVRETCIDWAAESESKATMRICRRAMRSLKMED